MYLELFRLKCHWPQNQVGADDVDIKVDDALVGGPHKLGSGEEQRSEARWHQYGFADDAAIDLYEEDIPGQVSQHLGRAYANCEMEGLGERDLEILKSAGTWPNGFRYTLTINVTSHPGPRASE